MPIEYITRIELPTTGVIALPNLRIQDSSIQFIELYHIVGSEKKTTITSIQIDLLNEEKGNAIKTVSFVLPVYYKQPRLEPLERNVKLKCNFLRIRGINQALLPGESLILVIDPPVVTQKTPL